MDPPQKVESSHQLLSAPPSIPVAVSVGAHGGGPLADLHLLGRDLHPDCPMVGAPLPDEDVFQCSRPTAETPQERGWKLGNGLGATGVELNKEGKAKGALSHRDNVEGVQPCDTRESLKICDLDSTPPQFHPPAGFKSCRLMVPDDLVVGRMGGHNVVNHVANFHSWMLLSFQDGTGDAGCCSDGG